MAETIDRTSLDLRFQSYRLQDKAAEARLLVSLSIGEIEQPLAGIDTPSGRFLLDGFKRYRCAEKLGIDQVPYRVLADEEAEGIIQLMRATQVKTLNILEQAKFVVELITVHGLSPTDVAETLSRSKAWVSMRRSLLDAMTPTVQEILFRGDFPVYAYMSTLRPFMRMNKANADEVERFVSTLSGQQLSIREIQLLAEGYFHTDSTLRQEIDQGNWKWSLEQLQAIPEDAQACNATERALLNEFEKLLRAMHRVMTRCDDSKLKTRAFFAQANLLVVRLLSKRDPFFQTMEKFYDRSGHA